MKYLILLPVLVLFSFNSFSECNNPNYFMGHLTPNDMLVKSMRDDGCTLYEIADYFEKEDFHFSSKAYNKQDTKWCIPLFCSVETKNDNIRIRRENAQARREYILSHYQTAAEKEADRLVNKENPDLQKRIDKANKHAEKIAKKVNNLSAKREKNQEKLDQLVKDLNKIEPELSDLQKKIAYTDYSRMDKKELNQMRDEFDKLAKKRKNLIEDIEDLSDKIIETETEKKEQEQLANDYKYLMDQNIADAEKLKESGKTDRNAFLKLSANKEERDALNDAEKYLQNWEKEKVLMDKLSTDVKLLEFKGKFQLMQLNQMMETFNRKAENSALEKYVNSKIATALGRLCEADDWKAACSNVNASKEDGIYQWLNSNNRSPKQWILPSDIGKEPTGSETQKQ